MLYKNRVCWSVRDFVHVFRSIVRYLKYILWSFTWTYFKGCSFDTFTCFIYKIFFLRCGLPLVPLLLEVLLLVTFFSQVLVLQTLNFTLHTSLGIIKVSLVHWIMQGMHLYNVAQNGVNVFSDMYLEIIYFLSNEIKV